MKSWRDEAYQDYISGMKYPDIAEKHNVTLSAVKKCAVTYWSKKKVTEKVTADKTVTENKVTAEPPPRQRGGANNVTHGAYKKVSWDVLEDDEHDLITDIDYTPEKILQNNLKNLLLRERRLLLKIQKIEQESESGKKPVLDKITKMRGSDDDKTITEATAAHNVRKIYEAELTKIQAQKIKCASELAKILKNNTSEEFENSALAKMAEGIINAQEQDESDVVETEDIPEK